MTSSPITIKSSDSTSVVTIYPNRGGLVSSWKVNDRELLYLPEDFSMKDSSWPGGGIPLCFPFAGRVWNNGLLYHYALDGEDFQMPLHGFAYASSWEVVAPKEDQVKDDQVHLRLSDNEASRVLYPFSFSVDLRISLSQGLVFDFCITHTPNGDASKHQLLPVALGLHPYFKVLDGSQVHVDLNAYKYFHVTPAGAAGKQCPIEDLGPRPIAASQPLMKSLILSDLREPTAALIINDASGPYRIEMTSSPHDIMRHFVVWTNQPDRFYALEPWMSLPDAVHMPSGCRWLKAGESLQAKIKMQGII
jgi:galactose mutarotase-like enzyme